MKRFIGAGRVLLIVALAGCSAAQKGTRMNESRDPVGPVTDRVVHVTALLAVQPARAFEYFT